MSELTAYHEAGHALMAVLLGGRVTQVTIDPDNDDGPRRYGDTQIRWRQSGLTDRQFAELSVQVSLAGPVAEMIFTWEPFHPGLVPQWAADWRDAWNSAALLHSRERPRMQYLEQVSMNLFRRLNEGVYWEALASLADNLLAHETLDAEQVEEIVREWL